MRKRANYKISMKRAIILLCSIFVISCSTNRKVAETKPLFEVLTVKEDGGATIRFFEILSEEREIKMLQNDETLGKKIMGSDINSANFVILNMGEKTTLGYSITIEKVEETANQIIIFTKDNEPKVKAQEEKEVFYYPHTIVKINSKKEIIIK